MRSFVDISHCGLSELKKYSETPYDIPVKRLPTLYYILPTDIDNPTF